ncbi:MAG TPA: hypothetical protein VJ464_28515 [Blastocatellia bacterium]|nr:hypothetical protein [Blastocatellia bacterium]
MSVYNPRIVAQALADLTEEMARWTIAARDMLAIASHTQRHARERVDRTVHHAAIVVDQAEQDEERVQKAIAETADLLDKCLEGKASSSETLQEAQNALQYADATLQEWEEELAKALAWLQRAEARLARAIAEYEHARRAYAVAQSAYERAVARYNACANNRERTNCDSEARDVRAAEVELRQAAAWVEAAEAEVMAAREEVEMAKARVACCRRAVDYASQAVRLAQEAEAEAVQAVNAAERGLEFAQAAEKLDEAAKESVIAEKEVAEHMMATTREAVVLTDEAAAHLISADKAEESSQRYSWNARQELQHRMELLHELNRADLYADSSKNQLAVKKSFLVAGTVIKQAEEALAENYAGESSMLDNDKAYEWDKVKHIRKGDAGEGFTRVRLADLYDYERIESQPKGLIKGQSRPDFAVKSLTDPDKYEEIVDSKAWQLTIPGRETDNAPPTLEGIDSSRLLSINKLKSVVQRYTSSDKLETDGRLALYFPEEVLRLAPQIQKEIESWSGTELAHGKKVEVRSQGIWDDELKKYAEKLHEKKRLSSS